MKRAAPGGVPDRTPACFHSGTLARVQNVFRAVTRRSPPPGNPPATSGYRLATLWVGRSRVSSVQGQAGRLRYFAEVSWQFGADTQRRRRSQQRQRMVGGGWKRPPRRGFLRTTFRAVGASYSRQVQNSGSADDFTERARPCPRKGVTAACFSGGISSMPQRIAARSTTPSAPLRP
jgi:hypothetical protein